MGGVSYRVAVAERSPVAGGWGGGRGGRVLGAARRSASSTVKRFQWWGRRHTDANPIRTKASNTNISEGIRFMLLKRWWEHTQQGG